MKSSILVLIFAVLLVSCESKRNEVQKHAYHLLGTAKDFPDSTKVYLYDQSLAFILDSTYVLNESFNFSGKLAVPSLIYLFFHDLENTRSEDYKYLFLENTDISVEGEYLSFFHAKVTGSTQNDLLQEFDSIVDRSIPEERTSNALHFIYANANNQMSLNELLYRKKEISKDSLLMFYKRLDTIHANSPKGQELFAYSKTIGIQIGDKFRDISGFDLKGVQHKLSDFNAKVLLLNFWSSDCPYSRQQNKEKLPYLAEKYKLEDFIIISYYVDKDKKQWEQSVERVYDNWLNISDLQGIHGLNTSKYDVTGTPSNFIIDKKGYIMHYNEGERGLEKEIDLLLQE